MPGQQIMVPSPAFCMSTMVLSVVMDSFTAVSEDKRHHRTVVPLLKYEPLHRHEIVTRESVSET